MGSSGINVTGNTKNFHMVKPLQVDLSSGNVPVQDGTGIDIKMQEGVEATSYPFKVDTFEDETVFFIRPDGTISATGGVITNKILIEMEEGQTDDPIEIKDSDGNTIVEVTPEGDIKTQGAFHLQPFAQAYITAGATRSFAANAEYRFLQSAALGTGSAATVTANAGGTAKITTITCVDEDKDNYAAAQIVIPGPVGGSTGVIRFYDSEVLPVGTDFFVASPVEEGQTAAQIAAAAVVAIGVNTFWSASANGAVLTITEKYRGTAAASSSSGLPGGMSFATTDGSGMGVNRNFSGWICPRSGFYNFQIYFYIQGIETGITEAIRAGLWNVGFASAEIQDEWNLDPGINFHPVRAFSFTRFMDVGEGQTFTPYVYVQAPLTATTYDLVDGAFTITFMRESAELLT